MKINSGNMVRGGGVVDIGDCAVGGIDKKCSLRACSFESFFTELSGMIVGAEFSQGGFLETIKNAFGVFRDKVSRMLNDFLIDIKSFLGIEGSTSSEDSNQGSVGGFSADAWERDALLYLNPSSSGLVSEADLQKGLVGFQLSKISKEAYVSFEESYLKIKESTRGVQTAIRKSLIVLVDQGLLSEENANTIFSVSHRASQLDEQTGAVSTVKSQGALVAEAIKITRANLLGIENGSIEFRSRTIR